MVSVADREIEPDHVMRERHRGIDRGGAGMVAAPHTDPADAVSIEPLLGGRTGAEVVRLRSRDMTYVVKTVPATTR